MSASPGRGPRPAGAEHRCGVETQLELSAPPQVIEPHERVPEFLLSTEDCQVFDSRELVGKQPFVVVFFASWCSVCEHKMPVLRELLAARTGQITPMFVSLDEAEARGAAREFIARHGFAPDGFVAGREFLGFSMGYDPFRSVPVVVVVGRSGRVVEVQVGVRDGDTDRLEQALDVAIEQAPEPDLFTFFPRR